MQDGDQQTSTHNMSEVNAEYLLSGGDKGEMDQQQSLLLKDSGEKGAASVTQIQNFDK